MGSQESVRFGEENNPESENDPDRVAHNSEELENTCEGEAKYHDANPGVDEIQGGFGSALLRECLGRITQLATFSAPCRSEGLQVSSDQPATGYEPKLGSDSPLESSIRT